MKKNNYLGVIGLGYVGLPLAIEFTNKKQVIAFDVDKNRINQLIKNIDKTGEISKNKLSKINNISFTYKIKDLEKCSIYIITVPTPINKNNKPDLKFIKDAGIMIGKILKKDDLVILESTVYPGLTEEFLIPLLEKNSGLKVNVSFGVGYSPERINPGDTKNTISNITKVTSGSNKKTAKKVNDLYRLIIKKGTHLAPSIKVAEASKIIENVQRDLNISLMNELSFIFNKLKINTNDVLSASKTKWNFLDFKPGLVGGHCIGVDPYYLTHKSKLVGYNPKIILSGRKVNSNMSLHIYKEVKNALRINNIKFKNAKIGVLGITFKENCADTRNSQVIEIIEYLLNNDININVIDPYLDIKSFKNNNIKSKIVVNFNNIDLLIFAVPHKHFLKFSNKKILGFFGKKKPIIFDIKSILNKDYFIKNKTYYWSL